MILGGAATRDPAFVFEGSNKSDMFEQQSLSQSGKQLSSHVPGHDGSTDGDTRGWYL